MMRAKTAEPTESGYGFSSIDSSIARTNSSPFIENRWARSSRWSTEGEVRLSAALHALLEAGGPEDLPPGASAETFAELALGAIYSTTLEWIHRDDYDLETRTAEIGAFLVSLLPDR